MKQIQDAPANPQDLEKTIPDHVAKAILRCLEKDPAKRFQTVEDLQAAILDESPAQKIVSTVRKDVPWTVVGLAAVAVILLLLGLTILSRDDSAQQQVNTSPSAAEFAAFHMAETLDTLQSWNAYLKDYQKGELVSVARERIKKVEARELEATKTAAELNAALSRTTVARAPAVAVPRPQTHRYRCCGRWRFHDGERWRQR
jgi:hypothetical protein